MLFVLDLDLGRKSVWSWSFVVPNRGAVCVRLR